MSDRDIVEQMRAAWRRLDPTDHTPTIRQIADASMLLAEGAAEIKRLRAERDELRALLNEAEAGDADIQMWLAQRERYQAALEVIAANRCPLCGAITDTPGLHECERRESATHWDDVTAKQVAQEALREPEEPVPCS